MFSSVGWSCQCCQPFPLWCALQSPGHSWACASLSPVCLCRGGTELRAALQMWSCQCWVGGKDHTPPPSGTTPPNAAQDITVPHWVHCWPVFTLVPSGTPRLSCFPAGQCPEFLVGLSQGFPLPCVKCVRVLSAPLCSLSGSPGMTWWPSGTSASPPSLCYQPTCWDCTWPHHPDH